MSKPVMPLEKIARAKAAYDFGISAKVIGRVFGISEANLYNWRAGASCSSVKPDPTLAEKLRALLLEGDLNAR